MQPRLSALGSHGLALSLHACSGPLNNGKDIGALRENVDCIGHHAKRHYGPSVAACLFGRTGNSGRWDVYDAPNGNLIGFIDGDRRLVVDHWEGDWVLFTSRVAPSVGWIKESSVRSRLST